MNTQNRGCNFGKGLMIGAGLGLLGGIAATIYYKKNRMIDPSYVLEKVKRAFLKEGPIEASWIEFEKKPLQKFAIHSKTYQGGIYRLEDNQMILYEFVADAQTGTVITITRAKA